MSTHERPPHGDRGELLKREERERELIGIPIGNLTSQLFINEYLNALDHWVKEALRERYYIRYTDDMVILHHNPSHLAALIPRIASWLQQRRKLTLHPGKICIRKLSHGIDFLGYVTLPHYRVLRTRTRRRMLGRVNALNVASYLGLLQHCAGFTLSHEIQTRGFFLSQVRS